VAHAQEATLSSALQTSSTSAKQGARVQAQINQMADETAELLGEYRLGTQTLDRLEVYNQHLQELVDDQNRVISGMDKQLADALVVQQEIVPLMNDMLDKLERFVELDMPILLTERRATIAKLREIMPDSGVTTAEKYRQMMEAYKSEMDIGSKISTYSDWLETGGQRRRVNFIHVGRILLAYQTEDLTETGFWDRSANPPGWAVLPDEYRGHIDQAMRIANKQAAPNLLKLPIPAPEAAR
jgi:hypothetical protein